MSPSAEEMMKAAPLSRFSEERMLVMVADGRLTAHDAAKQLTPSYMDATDEAVIKMQQKALEDFEFYRDLYAEEKHHDGEVMRLSAKSLRRLWDRE
jgi:hypothetical protein